MSATDKNLSAKASSRKPNTTLTEFIQLPELGNEFSIAGKAANNPNGKASAEENPSITVNGPQTSFADATSAEPIIGPVQEKETNAKVKAMKKVPIKPPLSAIASLLFDQELGKVIS